jgi:hypothetical protein
MQCIYSCLVHGMFSTQFALTIPVVLHPRGYLRTDANVRLLSIRFRCLHVDQPVVHYHTFVIHVKYSESDATDEQTGKQVLHEFSFPLSLCHLCKAMRTKRVCCALSALLRALCALCGWNCARL